MTIPLENPLRLAEDAATVDLISGGRVELGIGSGFNEMTFAAFGVLIAERRELTTRGSDLLYKALNGEPLLADGRAGAAAAFARPRRPCVARHLQRIWRAPLSRPRARISCSTAPPMAMTRAPIWSSAPGPTLISTNGAGPQEPRAHALHRRVALHLSGRRQGHRQVASRGRRVAFRQTAGGGGPFSAGLDTDGYLARLHCFYGHPDEIIGELQTEQTLPIATDVLCQVNPGVPTFDQTLKAMELIATKIAPAMGWQRADPAAEAMRSRA